MPQVSTLLSVFLFDKIKKWLISFLGITTILKPLFARLVVLLESVGGLTLLFIAGVA